MPRNAIDEVKFKGFAQTFVRNAQKQPFRVGGGENRLDCVFKNLQFQPRHPSEMRVLSERSFSEISRGGPDTNW